MRSFQVEIGSAFWESGESYHQPLHELEQAFLFKDAPHRFRHRDVLSVDETDSSLFWASWGQRKALTEILEDEVVCLDITRAVKKGWAIILVK